MRKILFFFILNLCCLIIHVVARVPCPQFYMSGQIPIVNWPVKIVCYKNYSASFSDVTLGNIYAAEFLSKDQVIASRKMKRYGHFDSHDPVILDYRNSGYDRGHMVPSGDMPDYQSQIQTFTSSNIIPQTKKLNSGKWNWIENKVRSMAILYNQIFVVTGSYFQEPVSKIGYDGIWVPFAVWKSVYIPTLNRAGVYFCKNTLEPICYRMSVAFFIQKTGIDPFPALSREIKEIKFLLPKPNRY